MCLSLQYHTKLVLCPNQPLHSHIHPTLPLKNAVSLSSVIKDVLSEKQDNSTLHLSLALEVLHGTSITCFFSPIFHWSFQTFAHTWLALLLDMLGKCFTTELCLSPGFLIFLGREDKEEKNPFVSSSLRRHIANTHYFLSLSFFCNSGTP